MSNPDTKSVLARIIAAHQGAGAGQSNLDPVLKNGLTRAIRRASLPYATLAPDVAEVVVHEQSELKDAVLVMPDHGLVAATEDSEGRRGLIAIGHALVDALIEVQATGHVEDTTLPPRKVTKIDEALSRDFIDLMFAAFSLETANEPGRDWPDRMSYGSLVADRAQLNLLLPEQGYRLITTSVTMGGRKTGDLMLLLPVDAAMSKRRQADMEPAAEPVDWSAQMLQVLGVAPMVLDAVLMRVTMPLCEVEALKHGDLVPFDHSDLGAVALEDDAGHIFARGGLGQMSGKRAIRLGVAAPSSSPKSTTDAPSMASATVPAPQVPGLDPDALPSLEGADNRATADAEGGLQDMMLPDVPMHDASPLATDAPMPEVDLGVPMAAFDPNAPIG